MSRPSSKRPRSGSSSRFAARHHSLHNGQLNFHGCRLPEQLDRQNDALLVFRSHQNALQARQWSRPHPHAIAAVQKWMRLATCRIRGDPSNRIDFLISDRRGKATIPYESPNAGCSQHLYPVLQIRPEEHVTGEKRQVNDLRSILPAVRSAVQWKEGLETFMREKFGRGLLVLMLRVNRIPAY